MKVTTFRFEPGGRLARIEAVRPVPRLNDVELRRCREQGRVTDQELAARLEIDPVDRYMGARSNVGENFVESPTMLEILRAILRNPC